MVKLQLELWTTTKSPQKWSVTATTPSCNWPNTTEYNWYGCQVMRVLAKLGSEAACGIFMGVVKKAFRDWKISDHRKQLDSLHGLIKQEKALIQGLSANKTRQLLELGRDQLRWVGGRTSHRKLSSKMTPFQIGINKYSHLQKVRMKRISYTHPLWFWGNTLPKI
jgi:hypothetical protein